MEAEAEVATRRLAAVGGGARAVPAARLGRFDHVSRTAPGFFFFLEPYDQDCTVRIEEKRGLRCWRIFLFLGMERRGGGSYNSFMFEGVFL